MSVITDWAMLASSIILFVATIALAVYTRKLAKESPKLTKATEDLSGHSRNLVEATRQLEKSTNLLAKLGIRPSFYITVIDHNPSAQRTLVRFCNQGRGIARRLIVTAKNADTAQSKSVSDETFHRTDAQVGAEVQYYIENTPIEENLEVTLRYKDSEGEDCPPTTFIFPARTSRLPA